MNDKRVVIVGGGIGGAGLALAVGNKRRDVLILEKEAHPPGNAGRPEVLSSATIDIFRYLGIDETQLKEVALPLNGIELHHTEKGLLVRLSSDDFDRNRARPYFTDPAGTRRVLSEKAISLPTVEVIRGVEVTGVIREGSRIAGVTAKVDGRQTEFKASLVVGDDGGNSLIRRQMGVPIKTKELPVTFVAAAGPLLPGLENKIGQGWVHPSRLKTGILAGVFVPLPGDRSAIVFLMKSSVFEAHKKNPSDFYREAADLIPLARGLEKYFPFESFKLFHRPFGHAASYVADGAAIMGDAAHPVTPVGGQGANMSVSDAISLAAVADLALAERDVSARRLAVYEKARRAANARSLVFSARARTVLNTLGVFPWLENLFVPYVRHVNKTPRTKDRLIQTIARTFLSKSD